MADGAEPIDIGQLEPCLACRALLPPGADRCQACGTVVGADIPRPSTINSDPVPPRPLLWLAIPAVVLAVAALLVGMIAGVAIVLIGGAVFTVALVLLPTPAPDHRPGSELVDERTRIRRWPASAVRWMGVGGMFFGLALPLFVVFTDHPHQGAAVVAGGLLIVAFLGAAFRFFARWSDAAGPESVGVPL